MRRYSLRLARLRRARRGSRHRSEVCQLRLELLQRLHLQLAHALAGEAKLAPDRLERLRLALKAEATLEDESLPFRQPFEPALHRLPEKRTLCLLDGVSGSRIGKKVGELAIAVWANRLIERDRSLSAAKRLADVSERQAGRLCEILQARLAAERGREVLPAMAVAKQIVSAVVVQPRERRSRRV